MTRSQDAAPEFIPASSTTAGSPAPATTRRTTRTPPPTSASRTRLLEHPFRDPGIGEVAEEHNLTISDPEDLDGRRGERLARRGDGRRCPHFHDHDLWVLGLVELRYLKALQPQRQRQEMARVLADRLPALYTRGHSRQAGEGHLDHGIWREQVGEAVSIPVQDHAAAALKDVSGRGGWHAGSPSFRRFHSTCVH